jgi:hypothetical protein
MRLPTFPRSVRQAVCRRGHQRVGDERQCLECQRVWHREHRRRPRAERKRGTAGAPCRRNAVGVLLARGPLDYDVPVTVRCGACGNVYETTLGEMSGCPHCRRIAA